MKFTKHDSHKSRLDLLPAWALEYVGHALGLGARKYAAHNWRKCKDPHKFTAAALRHVMKVLRGEHIDPESNLPHLAHAATSILFALEIWLAMSQDDSVASGNYIALIRRVSDTRGRVIKRYRSYERAWEDFVSGGMNYATTVISSIPSSVKVGDSYPISSRKSIDHEPHRAHVPSWSGHSALGKKKSRKKRKCSCAR